MDITYGGKELAGAVRCFEDSFFVPSFLRNELRISPDDIFKVISERAPWTNPASANWKYRGNELARQKFVLVEAEGADPTTVPERVPVYSYPGWQYGSVLDYRPFQSVPDVHDIVKKLELIRIDGVQVRINHVIGTKYRDANDNIGYHHDKVRDFTRDTSIILLLSLGETREMHIGKPDSSDPKKTVFERSFVLGSGDLFVLGPRTNALHRHAIVPVPLEKET